jgi:hypothetical protein
MRFFGPIATDRRAVDESDKARAPALQQVIESNEKPLPWNKLKLRA